MEPRKRKISIRKVIQTFVTLIVTTACVMAVLSASEANHKRTVRGLDVRISNELACEFLTVRKVREMLLENRHIIPEQTPLAALDLNSMEEILKSNPWVSDAEVYVDNTNKLHVVISQRVPVLRVFEQEGDSYYLDRFGNVLPLSGNYTHYALVFTNVPELKNDSTGNALKNQLLKLAQTIQADTFWNVQVASVTVNSDQTFEFVPVVGNHRIIIGDTSRLQDKLNNILTFYKEVCNRIGWDKYQIIDARFQGQIVASPSLPWKPPRDKAMSNMNWVKSIVGTTPPDPSAQAPANTASASAPTLVPTPQPVTAPAEPATTVKQAEPREAPKKITEGSKKNNPSPAKRTAEPNKKAASASEQNEKKETPEAPKYLYEGN